MDQLWIILGPSSANFEFNNFCFILFFLYFILFYFISNAFLLVRFLSFEFSVWVCCFSNFCSFHPIIALDLSFYRLTFSPFFVYYLAKI